MNPTDIARMSAMVRSIKLGQWTADLPEWSHAIPGWQSLQQVADLQATPEGRLLRAVQTAEVLLLLLELTNTRYDLQRFLSDCDLMRPSGPKFNRA